jgi:hypothetical protein
MAIFLSELMDIKKRAESRKDMLKKDTSIQYIIKGPQL